MAESYGALCFDHKARRDVDLIGQTLHELIHISRTARDRLVACIMSTWTMLAGVTHG
ncbi:MAG: hypothetical protein ACYCX3_10100 [Thermoleophilia bacterium]